MIKPIKKVPPLILAQICVMKCVMCVMKCVMCVMKCVMCVIIIIIIKIRSLFQHGGMYNSHATLNEMKNYN